MNNLKISILNLLIALVIVSCGGTNFMGAKKIIIGNYSVERWFLNPEYKDFETPKGTAFYGTAAEKVKDKFIIKYYISDDKGYEIQIPTKDMWKVKHNGKEKYEQDDDNLFYYIKDANGVFKKNGAIGYSHIRTTQLPIKECYSDGWCKFYIANNKKIYYVKKSILYQGETILNEKDKLWLEKLRKIALRDKIKVTPAIAPWITPPDSLCIDEGGQVNSRGVCQANSGEAYRICRELGARLPTIEELKEVVIQCGREDGNWNTNWKPLSSNHNALFASCYKGKGFSYEYNGYVSSTVNITKFDIPKGYKTMNIGEGYVESNFGDVSILCRSSGDRIFNY